MAAGSGSNPSCAKIAALSKKTCISYCQRARGLTVVAATGTSMRRVTSPDNVRRDLLELRPASHMAGGLGRAGDRAEAKPSSWGWFCGVCWCLAAFTMMGRYGAGV